MRGPGASASNSATSKTDAKKIRTPNSEDLNLVACGGRRRLFGSLAKSSGCFRGLRKARGLVPQPRSDRTQIGVTAEMKPELDERLGTGGVLSEPTQPYLEGLQPPEIVGQGDNPVLEALRRLWWRAFDRVCYCVVLIRLSIHDRVYGPEPPTPADLKRDADHERLVSAFPAVREPTEPTKRHAGVNRGGDLGSPYS
jgi:hypothetical protein